MKILQIHNAYKIFGGEDAVVENEKNLLSNSGHLVHQLIRKNEEEIKELIDSFLVVKNLVNSEKSKKIVFETLKKFTPDIVHIHNLFPLWSTSILNEFIKNKIPTIMTLHNYRMFCAKGTFYKNGRLCELCHKKSTIHAVINSCYKKSLFKTIPVANSISVNNKKNNWLKIDKFIALTDFQKKKFVELGLPKEKIIVKPHFVNSGQNNENYNYEKSYALYIGRLSEEKGLLTLIKAWKKINFKLKIFGDGPLKHKLKKEIGNNKNIKLNNFISKLEVEKEMQKAFFLIFPSEWDETFGMTIIEAFKNKLPVLSSNIGSQGSIVKNNINGFLFKAGDAEDLTKKANKMINNSLLIKNLREKAFEEYSMFYSEKKNIDLLINAYKETINNKK